MLLASAPSPQPRSALDAYDVLAPFYDEFTEGYEHDRWLSEIERWAIQRGLRGRRLLDVACGTGKSFAPMLSKGYDVTACDHSPRMVSLAGERAGRGAHVAVADMRSLPWWSSFDLVTCLDDAINYMLTLSDLMRALKSMRGALAPGGIAVFDANTLLTYRTAFADRFERRSPRCSFEWHGEESATFSSGDLAAATLSLQGRTARTETRHVQRHWAPAALSAQAIAAGFARVYMRGQLPGGRLTEHPDEKRHPKILYMALRDEKG